MEYRENGDLTTHILHTDTSYMTGWLHAFAALTLGKEPQMYKISSHLRSWSGHRHVKNKNSYPCCKWSTGRDSIRTVTVLTELPTYTRQGPVRLPAPETNLSACNKHEDTRSTETYCQYSGITIPMRRPAVTYLVRNLVKRDSYVGHGKIPDLNESIQPPDTKRRSSKSASTETVQRMQDIKVSFRRHIYQVDICCTILHTSQLHVH